MRKILLSLCMLSVMVLSYAQVVEPTWRSLRDFDKLFKAELCNLEQWAKLFEASDAKHVFSVTKHHDGYCLWDSRYQPNRNSVIGGPKRNIVDKLASRYKYLTSDELICHFVKFVAAGGGMILNVEHASDGQIPIFRQERLLDVGKWLKINSEAIYKTRPYTSFYEVKPVTMKCTDLLINFDWVRNSSDKQIGYDHFDGGWIGKIFPKYSEEYTFEVEVDDDVPVIVGNDIIIHHVKANANAIAINARENRNFGTEKVILKFKSGQIYPIKVINNENDLEAKIKLCRSSKSQVKEYAHLLQGFAASYNCEQPYVCFTTQDDVLYAILKYGDLHSVAVWTFKIVQ